MIGKKINSIHFQLLSPDIARKMSTIRVITPDTYDDDGYPIEAGLMDLRLGVIDPGLRCRTCGCKMNVCPGHFGHIELVRPVLHIGYIKMVFTLLKTTCSKCGRILLKPEEVEQYKKILLEEGIKNEENALEVIQKSKKASKCPHCKTKQGKIKLIKPTTFFEENQRLLPSAIRERLERITEHDLELLGINTEAARPEWTVLTALPVPPVTTRPSITLETGERSEDDLTHKLVDVLRINQRLADNISAGAPQLIIEDLWDLLQYHVTTYFNNDLSGIPPARHRTGRPLKTLFQRLKGKEGRFRYHLSGKRVNFSARTVISPDSNIKIEEVGVPFEIAKELTIPIKVTEWNIKEIKKILKNEQYPQVNYVIRPDGKRKRMSALNRDDIVEEVTPDYTVERQLIDGDIVMFNRQPSLHRLSMMGHRVKVLPGKTFRLNDAVSIPYNADYDGDEMNLHVPQTEEAKQECDTLMSVKNQLLSIRHGKPIVMGQLDHISGAYLMTKKDAVFSKEDTLQMLAAAGIEGLPGKEDKETYTGKEIFSTVIPKEISIRYRSKKLCSEDECTKEKCPDEGYVIIEKGQLKCGTIEAEALQGKLMKEICDVCGADIAIDFLNKATSLSLQAIMRRGLTISPSDIKLPEEVSQKIKKILNNAEGNVDLILEDLKKEKLERVPGKTEYETAEDLIMAELGKARSDCGKIALDYLSTTGSNAVTMAKTGAKGGSINVTQMGACLGQTAVRGKRILRSYKNKSLPHFKEGDNAAEARGFIKSSFRDGLKPEEFFFHAMSGRDSLVDKGIRTSISGYFQRRLINALIDISARSDATARDSGDSIIQFKYGEDGANPVKCYGDNPINIKKYLGDER